jgi:hypothetical protein
MLADRFFALAVQFGQLLLAKPDRLALQPNVQLGLPILTLVNQKLVHSHRLLMFLAILLNYRMAVKLRALPPWLELFPFWKQLLRASAHGPGGGAERSSGAAQEDGTSGGEDGSGGVVDRLDFGVGPQGSAQAAPHVAADL